MSDPEVTSLATTLSGDVVFTGKFIGWVDLGGSIGRVSAIEHFDFILARLAAADGMPVWGKAIDAGSRPELRGRGGEFVLVGNFHETVDAGCGPISGLALDGLQSGDLFLARFNENGRCMDSRWLGGTSYDNVTVTDFAEGASGFTVVGTIQGDAIVGDHRVSAFSNYTDFYVSRFSRDPW